MPTNGHVNAATLLILVFSSLLGGCASAPVASRPGWVDTPPPHDGRYLYFVGGSGWRASESEAKSAARMSASGQVPQYVASQIQSVIGDVQINENGVDTNRVEISVTVVGTSLTMREVSALQYWCAHSSSGYDCWALVGYPRAEYSRTLAEVDRIERDLAAYALELFEKASAFQASNNYCEAASVLVDAASALKSLPTPRELTHPVYANTDVLSREINSRIGVVAGECRQMDHRVAVRVLVDVQSARGAPFLPADQATAVMGSELASVVAAAGKETVPGTITGEQISACLKGDRSAVAAAAGLSRYLLVVYARSAFYDSRFDLEYYFRASTEWALIDVPSATVISSGSSSDCGGEGVTIQAAQDLSLNRLFKERMAGPISAALAGSGDRR
ncbi:MAG TPA: hypothetical protein PLZ31_11725 [Myxococcota bacterium]|nr:hypothetical protein [Myxococcota bacterium]